MGFLKKLFNNTTTLETPQPESILNFPFAQGKVQVHDLFKINGKGIVIAGRVIEGGIAKGFVSEGGVNIKGIEKFNKGMDTAVTDDEVGILTNIMDKEIVQLYIEEHPNKILLFYDQKSK